MPKVHHSLPISERFISIQGEGTRIGRLSYFIRVYHCNLRCSFCDTPYSYGGSDFQKMTIEEIAAAVISSKINNVVITGGEPCLYDLGPLIELLPHQEIEIETNGTLIPQFPLAGIEWNVSPKSVSAGEKIVESSLRFWVEAAKNYSVIFKFVVRKEPNTQRDLEEVSTIAHEFGIRPKSIFIMPEATNRMN